MATDTRKTDLFPEAPAKNVPRSVQKHRLEKDVEAALVKLAKADGWKTWKFRSQSQRSVPDRLFVKDGVIVFIELKRPGEKPTDAQYLEMGRLRDAGAHVTWTDNEDNGLAFLRGLA